MKAVEFVTFKVELITFLHHAKRYIDRLFPIQLRRTFKIAIELEPSSEPGYIFRLRIYKNGK